MPILSIIIPVYNKERYIDECIQSVLNQSFTNFELILVNDGSTDGSGTKCEYYQHQDQRVKLITQKNAGVSAARNAGLNMATGQYVGFIDSDDTIEPDMYELLIKNIQASNADISVCRLRVISPGKLLAPAESTGTLVLNHDDALLACLKGDLDRSANNKIYTSAIARSIQFEGTMYEDVLYTCKAFLAAQKTVVEHVIKYNYLVRENSASMSGFNPKYMQTVAVSDQIVKLVAGQSHSCIAEAQIFDVVANISILNLLLLADISKYREHYNQIVSKLNQYKTFISNTPNIAKKHKYAFKAFSISPKLYTKLMYMYCVITGADVIKRTQQAS